MKREVSLYLDLLRFIAAFVVFLQHFSWHHFSGGFLWRIGPFGAQAVIVFFVLSGYLIGHVTDRSGATARGYVLDRAARIYSVALPALVLTFVLDAIAMSIRPELFVGGWNHSDQPVLGQFLRCVLFLNERWSSHDFPGSNVPYWSMGYEVWYYIAFGLFVFLPRRWALLGALAAMIFIGPRVAALFPVWLLGVLLQRRIARHGPPSQRLGWLLFVGALLAWAVFQTWTELSDFITMPEIPKQNGWQLAQTALVGVFVTVHLYGMHAVAPSLGVVLRPLAGPIRWLAARSFTLYLFQVPLLQFLLAVEPFPAESLASRLLLPVGVFVLVIVLAEVTERQKDPWRRLLARLWPAPSSKILLG